jgi:uncharacterized protein YjdB
MKIIRGFLRLISILLLIGIVGFVVYFGLVTYGVIDSPYDKKAELISLSQSEIRLKKNKSFQLTSKVYPENTRSGKVKYKSDKPDIVSINEITGYVEAKKNGIATITAYLESNENIKAECLVVVSENNIRIEKIIVSPKNINLQIGKKYQISFKYTPREATLHEFEYMTSDPEVAIIDNLGMIEAKAEGQAYITVSDKVTGIQDSALVKVFSSEDNPGDDIHDDVTDPTGLEVSPQKVTINVDGSKQISAKVKPAKANQSVTWESIDTSIATVNSKGVVTGKQVGSTKIAATTVNGIEKLIDVTVTDKVVGVTGISVKNSNITLDVGKSAEIEYTIKPSNATNQGVTITSSDNGIVKVDGNKIIAMESGTAKVTIRTNDGGYKATINVKVNNVSHIIDETDINLSKTNVNLTIGGTTKVEASVVPSNATYQSVMWSSSNPNIASVNNGLIEGKSAGTTEVTVTTVHKNISKKIKVTVSNVEAQSISLNKKTLDLIVGSKDSLTVTFTPNNTSNKTITWTSSNTGVATVKDGLVVAKGVGTATITAKSSNGKTATCTVNVKADNVPVQSVSLNINAINTTVDDEIHLIATINPSNATNKKVTWESSNTSVATVSDGVVKTKGVGTATITVTTVNGKKDTCKVTVNSSIIDVQSVTLNTNSIKTKVGEEVSLTATVYPSNATNKTITWTSSDNSIVTVSSSGKIKGIKTGSATITAKSNNGKTATCKVTVESSTTTVSVTGVSLDNTAITLKVGGTKTLVATVSPSNATNKTITWTSSDQSVATISNTGVVTAMKEGTTTITATSNNGKTATCKVTVEKATVAVTGISLDKTSITIKEEGTKTLVATITPSNATNQTVTWTSSDTTVATVTSSGKVTGKKVGTATITAKSNNGKTATCKVTVEKATTTVAVTGISLDKTSITIKEEGTKTLVATITPSNATNQTVTWESSNTGVATVSSSGKVTGKKAGTATITAKSNNGKTATCKVTVEKATVAVTSISLDNTSITVKVDASKTLTATVYPDNATDKTVTWSSSDTGVATVSSSGKVTGKKAGTATITAKTSNGKTATCKVTVEKAATTGYVITEDSKYSSYSNKASYSSSTFKYRIFSYKSQDIVLVWVADPKTQLESALAYSNAQGVLPAETILKNEIKNYSLQNKGLVAVNASFFSNGTPNGGVVLSHGKIAKNNGSTSAGVIGVTNKGKLKLYVNEPASTFSNDGVRSTFVISSPTSIDHSTNNTNRTQICQYDTNNFVLLSGSGTVSGCGNIIISLTGCKEPYNLDGGGSRKLYYKTKDMSEPKKVFGGDRQLPDMLYFHD